MSTTIPKQQRAVQLVGPDQLRINENKSVIEPGPYQVLGRVEVVGLCFSDLKLLKQFAGHPRKSEVAAGIEKMFALSGATYPSPLTVTFIVCGPGGSAGLLYRSTSPSWVALSDTMVQSSPLVDR